MYIRLCDGKFQSLILVIVVETIPDIIVIIVLFIIGNDGRRMLVGITTVIRTTGRGFVVVVVPTTAPLHHHCDNDTQQKGQYPNGHGCWTILVLVIVLTNGRLWYNSGIRARIGISGTRRRRRTWNLQGVKGHIDRFGEYTMDM